MTKLQRMIVVIACVSASWGTAIAATVDPVVFWNEVAAQAVAAAAAAGRPGPPTILDMATVHAAVYDAVQVFDGRFEPYHTKIEHATGSPAAAVAKAAHDVLINRLPGQATMMENAYSSYLATNGLIGDPGILVGQTAAAGIINLRSLDGSFPASFPPFTGGTAPGMWRPTESFIPPFGSAPGTPPGPPPSNAPMAAPWFGSVVPFTLKSPDQFRVGPPPALTSHRYTREYNEVKALGRRVGSTRTDAQTVMAYFYSDNFIIMWNRVLRAIAQAHVHDIGDSARLFALSNLAAADAGITAWDSKRFYAFWRPLTAIRLGDTDGNPLTVGDPTWEPLINTPNYPDYTSGANNITGAMTVALALFFGSNRMDFDMTSLAPQLLPEQRTRSYHRFSDVAKDVVEARILLGIHFRTADVLARLQGTEVAIWAFTHALRPLKHHHKHSHGDHDDDDK